MAIGHAEITRNKSSNIDLRELNDKLSKSAHAVTNFLESKLEKNGSYGDKVKDLACYFKAPMLFLAANKSYAATSMLNFIQQAFMTADGDFKTNKDIKSTNGAYNEFWAYPNGWIVRAANQLGMKEISEPAYQYLMQYQLSDNGYFATHQINAESNFTNTLTLAHNGLINLELNHLDVAISVGNFLCEMLNKQTDLANGLVLRADKNQNLITEPSQLPFYFISTKEPNQLHFMTGYPAAFLASLYEKTNNPKFLTAAKAYIDFSLSCDESVYACDFSHKIAWAASVIYKQTGDEHYLIAIDKISDHFIKKQKDGMWFAEDVVVSYDQSAEIAFWFLNIIENIK